jgi:pimeloyl-ACP methyl ester carboxylesterase
MTLSYDDTGTGPAVLLIHAGVADRRMWDPQMPALTAAHRVVRCDEPGFGETPMPAAPYDTPGDLIALLDRLGIATTVIVAASGGGPVALEIAARRPSLVTGLVLLDSALPGHPRSAELLAFGKREDALLEAGDVDAATRLNVDTWLGPSATGDTRARLYEMQHHAFTVQLAGDNTIAPIEVPWTLDTITAPALLIAGAHDLPDFREIAAHLADRLPRARHVELDWAGHLPSMERPADITALLLDFL